MRIDRTWTISFEDHELDRLMAEIKYIELPPDLGWRPILRQVTKARQITLPLRAIERLLLELDMARAHFIEHSSRQDFQKRFPTLANLSEEVNTILYCAKTRRRSA